MSNTTRPTKGAWREDAAQIVESLFPVVESTHWDKLLDLRHLLLSGNNWDAALDLFLECRIFLEADHYLPFYRLRTLLCGSLKLESAAGSRNLAAILRKRHRSLEGLKRSVNREIFELAGDPCDGVLRVIEAS